MSNQPDEELMSAYITGDEIAFAVIYGRYSGKIYSFLRKKLKAREEVDEVFQKVFLKFHSTRKNYNSSYPLLQWFYVVARTTLLDHFRSLNRQIKTDEMPIDLNSLGPSQEPHQATLGEEKGVGILNSLSADQRRMVEMRFVDDLTYEEIAQALNKSQDSIRQTISRAFKKIRGES
ncbi:MAG: RNA polymerase sigma factor [Bacteriovoracaceae bacterium]|nr:RNA polymerase sigma factor [Bacteriovoracaceae bacterium]